MHKNLGFILVNTFNVKGIATGQYRGYALQPVLLFYHLLSCPTDAEVGLEYADDVSVHHSDEPCCIDQRRLGTRPTRDGFQAVRSKCGRPSSVIQFSTRTPILASVFWFSKARAFSLYSSAISRRSPGETGLRNPALRSQPPVFPRCRA